MSPKKKKLETALEGLFSSSRRSNQPGLPPDPGPKVLELPVAVEEELFSEPAAQTEQLARARVHTAPVEAALPDVAPQPPPKSAPDSQPAPAKAAKPGENRAAETASQPAAEQAAPLDKGEQILVFTLADVAYGLEIRRVESIIKMQPITLVPHTRPWVEGVTNLRGTVLPVINLRQRFGLPPQHAGKDTRIMVVTVQEEKIGLLVDSVCEVLRLPAGAVEPPPPMATSAQSAFLRGVANLGEGMTILLDLDQVVFTGKNG